MFQLPSFNQNSIGFTSRGYYYNYLDRTVVVKKSEEHDYQKLFLLSQTCSEYFFSNIPKNFTISTKNTTLHFNLQMLKETSPVISKFVRDNPTENNYFVSITDDDNILSKFAQLYQGKSVKFNESDILVIQRFTQILQIKNCPNFLKPPSLFTDEIDSDGNKISREFLKNNQQYLALCVEIYKKGFIAFLNKDDFKVFKIITKTNEYVCSIFGVYTSNVIRQILEKDSNANEFNYDFADNENEFQLICDFFNCKKVDITSFNMDILKEIAEDLQITCILQSIDYYIDNYEKVTQKIDEQQKIIDEIDELFDLLYNVKNYGIEKVKNSIVQSKWSKKEEDVKELSAFILQVIKPSFSLHKEIAELLIELDKEASEDNKLSILLPFTVERLMTLYWPKSYGYEFKEAVSNGKTHSVNCSSVDTEETIDLTNRGVYSFIRVLYKRGVISKEEVFERLENYDLSNKAFNAFFIPELIEKNPKTVSLIERLNIKNYDFNGFIPRSNYNNRNQSTFYSLSENYFKKYLPDKIGLYEKMLDSLEPDDELTKSLHIDDIDTFQKIIIRDRIDINRGIVPYNLFDNHEDDMSLLNYAALCGAVKCFKYLMLNEGIIDEATFYFAVCSGNNEIIKIVDQQKPKSNESPGNKSPNRNRIMYHNLNDDKPPISFWYKFNNSFVKQQRFKSLRGNNNDKYDDNNIQCQMYKKNGNMSYYLNYCNINNIIAPTIAMNENDLFNWIFENTFVKQNKNGNYLKHAALLAASSGNAHALIAFIDNGFFITKKIISECARNGFYKLTQLLLDLYNKNTTDESNSSDSTDSFDYDSIVHFGNLSIFKLFIENMNQTNLKTAFLHAIEIRCTEIIQYIFDNLNEFDFETDDEDFINFALKLSIKTKPLFSFLIDKFKKLNPEIFKVSLYSDLLNDACLNSSLYVAEEITDLILKENPKHDFTKAFFKASSSKSTNICQYFLDKKVFIDFTSNVNISDLGGVDVELFKKIINHVDPNDRFLFYECANNAIENKNIPLIEFIFQENPPNDLELIKAVQTNDLEVVDTVLKYNSKPSFINTKYSLGTGLCIACQSCNLDIVKRLLSIPGIDTNLYDNCNKTPLLIAIQKDNFEIVDALLTFYENSDVQSNASILIDAFDEVLIQASALSEEVTDFQWFLILRLVKIKTIDPNYFITDSLSLNKTYPCLILACYFNRVDVVESLLNLENIDVNKYEPQLFRTPLMVALERDNLAAAKLLIKHPKTNINRTNRNNESALTIAVLRCQEEIIDLLLNDERFDGKESRLNCGFIYSNNEIAGLLCSSNQLDVNQFYQIPNSSIKVNALEHSVRINDVEKIDMIINHPSFDVHKSRVKKCVFISIKMNNINLFNKLFELVGNDINIRNEENESLISYACKQKSGEIVDSILNHADFDSGSDELLLAFVNSYSEVATENDNQLPPQPNNRGPGFLNQNRRILNIQDPIWLTNQEVLNMHLLGDKSTSVEIMEKILQFDEEHKRLIDFTKLLPNGKSFFTAILTECEDIEEACAFLIEHGVDLNKPDSNGIFPLQYAIINNLPGVVNSLLNTGRIDLGQLPYENTYLHLAAVCNNSSMMNLLLQRNVIDINAENILGETPLMQACRSRRISNIELLFKKENIDFLHCSKSGKDALDLFVSLPPDEKQEIMSDKEKYYNALIKIINEERCFRMNQ